MFHIALKQARKGLLFRGLSANFCSLNNSANNPEILREVIRPRVVETNRNMTLLATPLYSKYRDMSLPYTEIELEGLRSLFRSMPSHKNGFINTAEDFPQMLKLMKWNRTPEQVENYVDYFHLFYGGKLSEEDLIHLMKSEHKLSLFAAETAKQIDQDGNGFISKDEFKLLIKFLRIHDPKLKERAFEDFLKEGSTRQDGKVNIQECADWIQKNM